MRSGFGIFNATRTANITAPAPPDNQNPAVNRIFPNNQSFSVFGQISIFINVTDDFGVDKVRVNVTSPDGTMNSLLAFSMAGPVDTNYVAFFQKHYPDREI